MLPDPETDNEVTGVVFDKVQLVEMAVDTVINPLPSGVGQVGTANAGAAASAVKAKPIEWAITVKRKSFLEEVTM